MTFDRYIAYWARTRPQQLYVDFEGRRLTWSEFDAAAGALAAALFDLGVGHNDRVGCLLPNSLEWCVCFAAAIRVGAIMVPLNTMFGGPELEEIAANAGCAAVLSVPSQMAKLSIRDCADERVRLYNLSGNTPPADYEEILAAGGTAPRSPAGEDDIVAICYTSGTTGVPKGIALSHRAVERMNIRVGMKYGWMAGEERFLILAPLAFTGGIITNLTAQFLVGASAWLGRVVDPAQALDSLVRHRITFFGSVPALWERIAAAPGFDTADLSHLRSAGTGGAPVPLELLRKFIAKGVIIRQQYGTSENCGTISCPDQRSAAERPEACGQPIPGVEVEIRDDEGRPVPPSTIGEICIRSDQIMKGYWNNPEETARAFDGEWYKTGDLGRFDEHGAIIVTDRKKNMLISGGINIYPAEVERGLLRIPGVVEAVAFGMPSEMWGQEVTAIVYAPEHRTSDVIAASARALLGPVKAPKSIVLSPEPLPKTISNKIARARLAELYAQLEAA